MSQKHLFFGASFPFSSFSPMGCTDYSLPNCHASVGPMDRLVTDSMATLGLERLFEGRAVEGVGGF